MVRSFDFVGDGEVARTGTHGRSVAGDDGVAVVGDIGVAIAGDNGIAVAGHFGYAVAGARGIAIAGRFGAAVAEVDGVAKVGPGGTITLAGFDEDGVRYTVTAEVDTDVGPSPDVLYGLENHRFVVARPELAERRQFAEVD